MYYDRQVSVLQVTPQTAGGVRRRKRRGAGKRARIGKRREIRWRKGKAQGLRVMVWDWAVMNASATQAFSLRIGPGDESHRGRCYSVNLKCEFGVETWTEMTGGSREKTHLK